ncbi:MAG: DDE-type integrase/transposase/recombinase [Nitrospiraceae bacterium]
MNSDVQTDRSDAVALRRFTLVSQLQEHVAQGVPLARALEQVSHATGLQPEGPVAPRTLEDWFYAFKRGHFGALKPRQRSDRGAHRVLSDAQQRLILDAVRAQPGIAIKVFYRRWKLADPTLPSLSSVHRLLVQNDLAGKSRRHLLRQHIGGPTKAWESSAPNELWMADFSPGPYLVLPGESKARPTHLCVLLDDHSRLVPHASCAWTADTRSFHAALKDAIQRRGVPRALYVDNGGPFINEHTRVVCAQLGLRLLHTRPYHAWSKGKVERFFHTLQVDFEGGLKIHGTPPIHSLEELNQRLFQWIGTYHDTVHSTTGEKPQERFARLVHTTRGWSDTAELERLFYQKLTRRVRKDGTVRLENDWFEVDLALRGLEVELRFCPWKRQPIEVHHRGQRFGDAHRLDRQLNAQIQK